MPDRSSGPLAEMREVEERLAVRMARIDQLQAAVASSQSRGPRLTRTLAGVSYIGALATVAFGIPQSVHAALDISVATAAVGVALMTGLYTFALRQLVDRPSRNVGSSLHQRMFVLLLHGSPGWEPFPVHPRLNPRRRVVHPRSRTAPWLLVAALISGTMLQLVGGVAFAIFALLLVSGILRFIWAGQATAPRAIQQIGLLVAISAALSIGGWAGGAGWATMRDRTPTTYSPVLAGLPRQADATGTRLSPSAPRPSAPTSSSPTYEDLCGPRSPWLTTTSQSQPLGQLREMWLSAGAIIAGCPSNTHTVGAHGALVMSVGRSPMNGEPLSIGIAGPSRGVMFFAAAAAAARPLIEREGVTGVPTHLVVGGGNFYLVDTHAGTFVLIQRTTTSPEPEAAQHAESGGPEGQSDERPTQEQPYLLIQPTVGLVWLQTMEQNSAWLWPRPMEASGPARSVEFLSPESVAVGRASCEVTEDLCKVSDSTSAERLERPRPREISAEDLLRYAPSP